TRAAPSFSQALQALQERFRDPDQNPLDVKSGKEAPRYLVPYETIIDMALRMASGEDVDLSLPPTPLPLDPSAPRGSAANPIDLPPIWALPPVGVDGGRMTPPPPVPEPPGTRRPSLRERAAQLKAEGKSIEEARRILADEGYTF